VIVGVVVVVSTSLSISIASGSLMLQNIHLDHLSISWSDVRKVYCGKMAHWIQMPFGMVSGVGRGMGVLDGVVVIKGEAAFFGGEFEASHCNQCSVCCLVVRKCVNQSSCRLAW